MKKFAPTAAAFFLTAAALARSVGAPETPGILKLKVLGLRSSAGSLRIAIFRNEKGFPSSEGEAFSKSSLVISGKELQTEFKIPFGRYALALYHDENGDQTLNKGLFGVPKEGYGVSNNKTYALKAPRFSESAFDFTQSSREISVRLRY